MPLSQVKRLRLYEGLRQVPRGVPEPRFKPARLCRTRAPTQQLSTVQERAETQKLQQQEGSRTRAKKEKSPDWGPADVPLNPHCPNSRCDPRQLLRFSKFKGKIEISAVPIFWG